MSNRFAGMERAEVYTQGSYFDTGEYKAVIKDVLMKDTRNSGPAVIVEFEVVESSNANAPAGCKRSWVQTLKSKDVAWPNLLAFLAVLFGVDSSNAAQVQWINTQLAPNSARFMEELVDRKTVNGQPVVGKVIRVSAFPHTTKQNKTITRVRFFPGT